MVENQPWIERRPVRLTCGHDPRSSRQTPAKSVHFNCICTKKSVGKCKNILIVVDIS